MATRNDWQLDSSNGHSRLYITEWLPKGAPRGIIHICHGMTEHISRYERLANDLTAAGYIVVGDDHLGHGRTADGDAQDGKPLFGYFGESSGAAFLVEDTHLLRLAMSEKYPALPYYLLGHSMGSFITRNYLTLYGQFVDGYICSGTAGTNPALPAALALTNLLCTFGKGKRLGRMVNKLAFGGYGKAIGPMPTGHEWLTRDTAYYATVDADRYCRFLFTNAGFRDLFRLLGACSGDKWAARMPKALPVFIVAGDKDPVGDNGKGPREVYDRLVKAGLTDVTIKLYPDARHELHNELCREEYIADVLAWLEAHPAKERNGSV